ncbi:hypothetical protein ACP70R_010899 [Stipagrostis hirtigluma subsp. patula]
MLVEKFCRAHGWRSRVLALTAVSGGVAAAALAATALTSLAGLPGSTGQDGRPCEHIAVGDAARRLARGARQGEDVALRGAAQARRGRVGDGGGQLLHDPRRLHLQRVRRAPRELTKFEYGEGRFGGEPCFVPMDPAAANPRGEDDGYVLTFVHDERAGTSELLVVNGAPSH